MNNDLWINDRQSNKYWQLMPVNTICVKDWTSSKYILNRYLILFNGHLTYLKNLFNSLCLSMALICSTSHWIRMGNQTNKKDEKNRKSL